MSDPKYAYYLLDLGFLLKERAFEARQERNRHARDTQAREFHSGRLMALYEVISLMQQQAEVFQIPLAELRLEDIDPENDLLSGLANKA